MLQDGRRIGSIKTSGAFKRNARDLPKSQVIPTGKGAPPPPPPRKYRNVKVEVDGHQFDSKREAEVYVQLRSLEKAGAVRSLVLQPRFKFPLRGQPLRHLPRVSARTGKRMLGVEISYRADFSFEEQRKGKWVPVVIDVKGFDTQISRLKRAMVTAFHNVVVEIVG